MHYEKKLANTKDTVICPKCGGKAREVQTKYGIRSDCCGLWSYDREPMVDKATHEARKAVYSQIKAMSAKIGPTVLQVEMKKRGGFTALGVRGWNEVTCLKAMRLMDDMLVDVIAGDIQPAAAKKR